MKKVYFSVIALLCLVIGVAFAMQQTRLTTTNNNTPSNVLTSSNPVYTLNLSSNPSTGYSWFVLSYDPNLLTIDSHKYVAPDSMHIKPIAGAPGHEIWQFQATPDAMKAPHITTIKMVYARPWEMKADQSVDPSQIKSYTVVIVGNR